MESIIIRDFEPRDLERVKFLFEIGMRAQIPNLTSKCLAHAFTTPGLLHPVVGAAAATGASITVAGKNARDGALVGAVAVLAFGAAWHLYYSLYRSPSLFDEYIAHSLATDLSGIPSIYQKANGVFLVATGKDTDHVVGMVGGEFKGESSGEEFELAKGAPVYELRRMSVDPEARGKGLGTSLIRALEERLPKRSLLFADCTNIQPAAHRLYASCGFQLTRTFSLPGWPDAFRLWRYEKQL